MSQRILLMQLPVPPPGEQSMEGNIPLAAAFLKLYARRQGLERDFEIEIFPPSLANSLGDQALLRAVLQYRPDCVGLTCYLWNVERSLWLAEQIKLARPGVKILLGGPEITADNRWVLENASVDFAIFGEGEAAFAEILKNSAVATNGSTGRGTHSSSLIDPLDAVSSPYLEGILDAGSQDSMLLETVRGCRYRCKYCYYSKRNSSLRYLSCEQIEASLRHAVERGASEVYLLDPTINQRPDFVEFLKLLAHCNPHRQLTYSGELRAEGIDSETAKLLKKANFAELEIGLQSIDPLAHRQMGRPVNLESWERGVRALMAEGIRVRLDLILGLPGDTYDSIRRGIDFLSRFRPTAEIQIFNLSILPGTDFRREATALGLKYQARPPYYVYQTPTLDARQIYELMAEAQSSLDIEFDAPALPSLNSGSHGSPIDLDELEPKLPSVENYSLVSTLHFRSEDFSQVESKTMRAIADALRANPYITLQIVLEPRRRLQHIRVELLREILELGYSSANYLDRFYSMQPGHLLGSLRLFVLLPLEERAKLDWPWIENLGEYCNILWYGTEEAATELEEFEHVLGS